MARCARRGCAALLVLEGAVTDCPDRRPLNPDGTLGEHPYQNPDRRCQLRAQGEDYCWSYALHVDGHDGFEDLESACRDCDLWEPADNRPPFAYITGAEARQMDPPFPPEEGYACRVTCDWCGSLYDPRSQTRAEQFGLGFCGVGCLERWLLSDHIAPPQPADGPRSARWYEWAVVGGVTLAVVYWLIRGVLWAVGWVA